MGKKCGKKSFEVQYVCLKAKIFEIRVQHLNSRLTSTKTCNFNGQICGF